MSLSEPLTYKKHFTPGEANAMLPLVRSIVRDISELAHSLRERHERLYRAGAEEEADDPFHAAYREERVHAQEELEADQQRLQGYVEELTKLGVELKDYFAGLVDFPCLRDGREVYLCWKLGEPEVGFWHELEAGFAGRQKL